MNIWSSFFYVFRMNRTLVKTKDDSYTLFVPELDEHYHSIHGAIQEAEHVFIDAGLSKKAETQKHISILEIGFGTGLNAWLTCLSADVQQLGIEYTALEKYPVKTEEWAKLEYVGQAPARYTSTTNNKTKLFQKLHQASWEEKTTIDANFSLLKKQLDFRNYEAICKHDLVYFDAFAPSAQPNLWTLQMFKNMYRALKNGGVLVTYCVKGDVRRNMQAAGFEVEKIKGPPGKREMARAFKR